MARQEAGGMFQFTESAGHAHKILALGNQHLAQGKVKQVADVVQRLRSQKVSD